MAEESVDLPVIPGVTMSSGVELRRHSSGRASSGNVEAKVVPQYLRASTGSCHDFCKYGGRKHVVEAKEERLSIPKRAERKPRRHSSEEIIGGIMTSVSKLRASADSEPTKIPMIRRRQSVDSVIQISVAKSSESLKQMGNKVVVNKNKTPFDRVKSSLLQNSHVSSINRRQEIASSFKVETPSLLTSKRVEPPLKSTSERGKTLQKSTSQMAKTSSKPTSKTAKTSSKLLFSKDKEMEFAEKYVTSLNPDSITTPTVSSMNSSGRSGGQRKSEIKMEKKKASCKVASPLRASFPSKPLKSIASIKVRMNRSLKIVSSLKNQPKPRKVEAEEQNHEAQEKTLYVIKMGSEEQTLQSDQNASQDIELPLPHSLSSPKFSSQEDQEESESESESATNEYVEILEVEENGKPQKDGIESFEDKDCQNFEEKFVETVPEKSGLLRLKFRRGIVLVGNATDINADADNIDGVSVTEKVVLRHQDVQDKKDGLVLFNNVIEETASKLVETQKSKVKALVGAFETVISLQEKKPVFNTVN